MTPEETRTIQVDRMRFTKDKLSSGLVLLAVLFDCLYFVSIYSSDVGSYYYTWQIGASIIYNLVFLLVAFLASEGVKSRKSGYTAWLLVIGVMQFVRIFPIPVKAHRAVVSVSSQEIAVMGDGQFAWVVICLVVSGICCLAAALISCLRSRTLTEYMKTLPKQSA